MNRMIFAAIALFAACIIVLGQVQLTNLDQKSFTVDIAAPVTNIVNLNLRRSQFSPSTSGWILTNISGVFGGSTNITTNSIWGIDGFGNITPIVTNNAVIATNIVRYGVGRMFGTESWLSKALTLTNGPNYIGAAENSQFFLIGPTTNPVDCQIILSNAVATGQKLVLVNQTNAIPAEGAWTLTNNTPIPDGAGVVKLLGGYDLLSTNGYISYFEFISPDWQEVGRILASGASGLLTNVFNNIVVYSNITLKGNASLTINNVTLTTNDIWHTNIVAGVTNLQPVNLNLPVVISNTLSFQGNSGTNFLSASGNNLTWKSLSSTPQLVLNDGSTSTTYAPAGITDAGTSGAFQLYVNGSGGGATAIQLQGVGATHFLTPVTADVQLGYSGTSFLWEGSAISTRNRPSQWWGYSSGTGSADFELSHTGTNGVVLFNSVAINDAGVPRAFSFTSNGVQIARINMNSGYTGTGTNVFLDNGTFGAVPGGGGGGGSTNTLWYEYSTPDAEGGTVYTTSNTNAFKTDFLRFSQSYLTNFWNDYSGSFSLGANTPDPSSFDSTENVAIFNIGDGAGNSMSVTNGSNIYSIGNGAGNSMGGTNSTDIINIGYFAGSSQNSTNCYYLFNFGPSAGNKSVYTNSHGVYNIGSSAGFQQLGTNVHDFYNLGDVSGSGTFGKNSYAVYNLGEFAGEGQILDGVNNVYNLGSNAGLDMLSTNSHDIYNWGYYSGFGIVSTNSHDLYNFGFQSGYQMKTTNSSDIYALGPNAMINSKMSNSSSIFAINGAMRTADFRGSTNVTAIGNTAGQVTGTFNNMIFLGNGSTASDGSANQVVLGTAMLLNAPGGFASLAADTGAITSTGWTNSLGKDADVAFDATTLIYKLADNSGAFWYTNTVAVGQGFIHLQPGGKFILVSGSGLSGQYHAH